MREAVQYSSTAVTTAEVKPAAAGTSHSHHYSKFQNFCRSGWPQAPIRLVSNAVTPLHPPLGRMTQPAEFLVRDPAFQGPGDPLFPGVNRRAVAAARSLSAVGLLLPEPVS